MPARPSLRGWKAHPWLWAAANRNMSGDPRCSNQLSTIFHSGVTRCAGSQIVPRPPVPVTVEWARCGSGEIGRHAGFRFLCLRAWGFNSPLPHQRRLLYPIWNSTKEKAITAIPAITPYIASWPLPNSRAAGSKLSMAMYTMIPATIAKRMPSKESEI